ncbi:hypothetical protein EDL79_01325 [Ehrlichia ruminantium]|uniref:Uncharacterized protein n=1 Tax=Ehrlichia ruminantium TaxID=779 RepID=A0AAE6Q8V3_EHRRU|nr:hypothetical protein [Ehrlichia ruminantium]QGR02321.1 hypothetical protein EDL81_01325 [Ehrlichia ruminantium]QGR03241.1 hypothetical protein EDL80_01325 [Ehrlichia ruminantium]QGR04166.1 hypothetical protein EDL79_01325 [Ehrlichia ruminantium]
MGNLEISILVATALGMFMTASILIAIMIKCILSKRSAYTINNEIPTTTIPNLSEDNLSEMFNSADTKLQEINSPYNHKVILNIDGTIITAPVIKSKYEALKKDGENHPLVKKHIEYLQKNRTDNSPDNINRAILGASIESILLKHDPDNTPDTGLIHHMINHMYTKSYMHLLSHMINQGIPNKEKYTVENLSLSPQITLHYTTNSPQQFSIDAKFYKKLLTAQNNTFHSTFTGDMRLLVSQSTDDPKLLDYSEGKVSYIHYNTLNEQIPNTQRSNTEMRYTPITEPEEIPSIPSISNITVLNTEQQETSNTSVLPNFTVYTHSAEQMHDNIPKLDTITTATILYNRDTPLHSMT